MDHGSPISLSQVTTMSIHVKDADDQNPLFTQEVYKASVSETAKITGHRIREKVVVQPAIHAFDLDTGINARLRYTIILGNEGGFFEMHDQTGELFLVREIDLESLPNAVLSLQIQAAQVDNPLRQALARVDVSVMDVNDNSPEFEYDMYNITVMENLPPGFTVLQVFAVDADKGDNAHFKYLLDDPSGAFKIDENTGWISVKDPTRLDRESNDRIQMKVTAIERKPNINPEAAKAKYTTVELNLLDANDNNPQFFPQNLYTFAVLETAPAATIVGSVYANDKDLNENGRVVYYKQNDTISQSVPFDVFPHNGSIYVTDTFPHLVAKPTQYTFFVVASDSAKSRFERRTGVAIIRVNVTDINNSVPEFVGAPFEAYVGESLPEGAYVTQIMARDNDAIDTNLEYSIVAGNDEKLFLIDSRAGRVFTAAVLDFERKQSYDLLVQVSDGINTAVAPLLVNLVDINDNAPHFTHNFYNFSCVEEMAENMTIGSVLALDRDSGKNAVLRYSIIGDQASDAFIVEPLTGNIRTRLRLDRESESKIEFMIIAYDSGIPQLSGTTSVVVAIEDINDNAPYFEQNQYVVEVSEELEPPVDIFQVKANDRDANDNAVIKYLILAGNDDNVFNINPETGLLSTAEKLNYERKTEYKLYVAARNLRPFQGPNAANIINPSVEVIVRVRDINDELVIFDQQSYHFRVFESLPKNQAIGFVNATNPGRLPNEQDIIYWIGEENRKQKGKFAINQKTGELILKEPIDRDMPNNEQAFKLKIYARDRLSINSFNTSVPVIVDVLDVNDNSPVFNEDRYVLELPESLPSGTTFPAFYRVSDLDAGLNGKIVGYYLNTTVEEHQLFAINNQTGVITLLAALDSETRDKHEFGIIAVDGGQPPNIGTATVVVNVANINEYSPKFVGLPYEFLVQEKAFEGTSVGQVRAIDEDGNAIKYSVSDGDTDFFYIEEDSGRLFVKKPLISRTQYTFIVRATDDGVPQNFSLGVQVIVKVRESNDYPPVFTSSNYHGVVVEKRESDKVVVKVEAIDKDLQNNSVSYSMVGGNEDGVFVINGHNGEIKIVPGMGPKLNYDNKKQYSLLVQATDSHITQLYGLAMVVIDVQDTNDHSPVFSKSVYSATLPENLPAGHCFLTVEANSRDTVDSVSYLLSNTKDNVFAVNKATGEICTKKVLDREVKDKYEFSVVATDGKFEVLAPVSVEIIDENDNPPRFEQDRYLISIPYDLHPGRTVIQVQATDPDSANNGDITYWIKNTHGMFEIDAKTGLVRLVANLPMDKPNATYEMEVFAQDHGVTPNIGKSILVVRASNTINHPPKFDRFSYSVNVDENVTGIPLIQVLALDPDPGKAGKVIYRIVKSSHPNAFRIDKTNGRITLESALDYESSKYHEIVVEARDETKESQSTTTVVQIHVNDINDNSPEILSMPRILRVPQSVSPNSEVIYTVQSTDLDSDRNGNNQVVYAIEPQSHFFAINALTGQMFATQKLIPMTETLRVIAADKASAGQLFTSKDLRIEVYKDSIEEPTPVFTSVQYFVQSDTVLEPGATLLTPRATIPNGSPVWYNISSVNSGQLNAKKFNIDHDSGRIFTSNRLDPSDLKQNIYHFIVSAHNKREPLHYSESGVVIRLLDHNIRCPKFPFTEYYASIKENSAPDMIVLPDLLIEDVDKFSGQRLSYQITEDNSNDNFYIDVRQGGDTPMNVTLRIKKILDRDSMPKFLQGVHTLAITASNQRCSANSRVKIMVEDVNDNNPVFSQSDFVVELKENTPIGQVVTTLTATDKDEVDDGKLRYHVIEGNEDEMFDLEEKTGVMSVKIIPDRERSPAYVLRVVAIDSANNTGWANVHIIILDENDWTPTFLNETFVLNVTEGPTSIGTRMRLPVVDYDDGINRQMEVYIVDGNANGEFRLDVDEGGPILTIVSELDREKYNVKESALHVLFVAAKDKGQPQRMGKAMVAVVIQDINDSPPKFERDSYYQFISEDAPVGIVVAELKATDADSPANTNLVYSFAKNTGNVPFTIDPITGIVNISRQLDISESQHYILIVDAFDGQWKSSTNLNIYVSEAEERDPRFDQSHYRFAVLENQSGVLVGRVELKPRKHRINALMKYTIVNTEMRSIFNITQDGEIYTKVGLDREKRSNYIFTVKLEEKRPVTKISVSEVIVDVLDMNDEVPLFTQIYRGHIKENSQPGTAVSILPQIQAHDKDAGNNSLIAYSLAGDGSDMFTILDSGTVLFTPKDPKQIIDREVKAKYELKVTAVDRGSLSSTSDLTISVEDENDNAPAFQHGPLYVLLPEVARPGSKVVEVKATDADEVGPNSKIQYYITHGGKGDIRIDKSSGEIFVVGTLVPGTVYFMNVSAVDGNGLAARTTVNVTIVDVNNHKPTFENTHYQFNVVEGNYTANKLKLGVLRAKDEDIGRNGAVEYAILNNVPADFPFSVDVYTGELFAKGFIDREQKEIYNFEVTALDSGEPPTNSSTEVKIIVGDRNDERPRFYTDPYLAHVPENLDPGHKVTQIVAFDPDMGENGQVFYKLGDGHDNKFYIDGKDGTVWTLSALDYEDKSFYNITVIAYDKGSPSLSSVAKLWVTVADTSDSVPDFAKAVYTVEVAENAKPGDTVFTMNAGDGPFKYTLLNSDEMKTFAIETSNGRVKLTKALDSVQRNHYRLVVKAEDDSEPPKSDSTEVNIIVGTGQGVRLFPQRLYEVSVMENQLTPLQLIDLNSTDELAHRPTHYSIVGTDYRGLFKIGAETGRLVVTRSLDREKKDIYHLKIRAENVIHHRVGRRDVSARNTVDTNYHLAFDETLVVVNVHDENDNPPVFDNKGRPVVAAIPLEANFGYQVVKLAAKDADIGINGAIRYEILSRGDDSSSRFHIDPVSGVIRSMVTFTLDGGKLYGFDVKATDREGSENGNSAVTNIFIYVLPETKMILFVADKEPIMVEKKSGEILSYLTNITGFDVKMAKLGPHTEGDQQETQSTDIFLYAVNPDTNDIVDTETLLDVFRQNSQSIVDSLRNYKIRRIQGVTVQEKISQMGATEIAIIALSSVIFLGTVLAIALLCSSCKERKLRQRQSSWEQQRLYNTKNPLMGKTLANPYGNRGVPVGNGHSSSNYSTNGDGVGDYVDSLASYKRTSTRPGSRSAIMNKCRQQVPPDGASSLNPPRSPRFSDRYKHSRENLSAVVGGVGGGSSGGIGVVGISSGITAMADSSHDWGSGFSRGSGQSARSGYSGTSWSSRKSRNSEEMSPGAQL
ncbi:protocadherin Fat 4-like isoform X2 [Oppia nitens]|uniref:protocadherin Fat 4-like isoform X2 n=1 Tax=Oppia nitens TaxID=1686743 RepID=UPI0023DC3A28|nr:protocadherin Fat 4-like isoform X2 [Oppia nitens]